jgi:hypothetical protein
MDLIAFLADVANLATCPPREIRSRGFLLTAVYYLLILVLVLSSIFLFIYTSNLRLVLHLLFILVSGRRVYNLVFKRGDERSTRRKRLRDAEEEDRMQRREQRYESFQQRLSRGRSKGDKLGREDGKGKMGK